MENKKIDLAIMGIAVALGITGMLGGEMGIQWAGPVAFAILRAYIVISGYLIRERLGEQRGGKITKQWTWGAVILTAGYVMSLWLVEIDDQGNTAINLSNMIALQATNIMLVGVEIYFSIGRPEHPAEIAKREMEDVISKLEDTIGKNKKEMESLSMDIEAKKLELGKLQSKMEESEKEIELNSNKIEALEQVKIKSRDNIEALEGEIEALKSEIGSFESIVKDFELEVETLSDVQVKEIEKVRLLEKWKSNYVQNASKISVLGNTRACGCKNCGTIVMWGQVKKGDKICPKCETIVAS